MQKLYLVVSFLVVGPDVEGSLHQQLPQFTQVSLWKHPHRRLHQQSAAAEHDQLQVRL